MMDGDRTDGDRTRRRFLLAGASASAIGLAGCNGLFGGVRDTDGDGVVDSEDYAPRDPDVQRREQLVGEDGACETETPSGRTDMETSTEAGRSETEEFSLDFRSPPAPLEEHVETIDGEPKLVLRDEEVEYEVPEVPEWERIEYGVMGQSAGNTHVTIRSAQDGRYSSFVGIRPWMRWSTAVEGFNGANTYPDVDWEDVRADTEYRVVIDRTGGATGRLTVRDPDGDAAYSLETETVFDVYEGADDANFVPSALFFKSNDVDERAVFDDIVIR